MSVRYADFVHAVRRYRPSDLLRYLARHSATKELQRKSAPDSANWFPWAISAIAKESILGGDEFRRANIDSHGFLRLLDLFNLCADIVPGQSAASILTPILYEQFPYQESIYEEMARTHALLVHDQHGVAPIRWTELLGVGLDEAMRSSIILHSWTVHNEGRFDPDILDNSVFEEFFEKAAPRHEIETTAFAITATIRELRGSRAAADKIVPIPSRLERYAFNPLKAQPLVDIGAAGIWAPQTMLIPRAFTGTNLYYRGLAKWGKAFADSLGDRTQSYVGRQLDLLSGIILYPEIEYAKSQKSIDWIWISESAVILIECKAARLTLDAQAGGHTLADNLKRYIGTARKQIDKTAQLIRARHEAFAHIPADRPIVGIVTTAEPFYLANTPFSGYDSSGVVPTVTISLRDLEFLVGRSEAEAARLITDHAHPAGEGGRISAVFGADIQELKNPILDEAWSHYDLLSET